MAHVLNKLIKVNADDIKRQLEDDAPSHAKQGMYLEHLWQNADNPDEIYFLFRVEDIGKAQRLWEKVSAKALTENPEAKLPEKVFLVDI